MHRLCCRDFSQELILLLCGQIRGASTEVSDHRVNEGGVPFTILELDASCNREPIANVRQELALSQYCQWRWTGLSVDILSPEGISSLLSALAFLSASFLLRCFLSMCNIFSYPTSIFALVGFTLFFWFWFTDNLLIYLEKYKHIRLLQG